MPGIDAVIFDWGGTLTHGTTWTSTPSRWRSPRRSWRPASHDHAAFAARLHEAGRTVWGRSRDHQQSSTVADLFNEAGLEHDPDLLTAYYEFWEPHTPTDPEVRPTWEALRAAGVKVGVLSNTIWPREWHRGIFERDGVLRPDRRRRLHQRDPVDEAVAATRSRRPWRRSA